MSEFHLISIGKLKNQGLEILEADFLKRLQARPLHIHELKSKAMEPQSEAPQVLNEIEKISPRNKPHLILLDETGKSFTSTEWSKKVDSLISRNVSKVIFCIGGAFGHPPELRAKADELISLGPMTLPHRLARVLFVEQFYRAYTLSTGHPYHNE